MTANDYALRSLRGLWVGDCIGNMNQLYNIHDVLQALEKGLKKYGGGILPSKQFQFSDDTEEAIVLYNHLVNSPNKFVDVDKLAMEFATRFMERDPDGEEYGYGLMTRTVLKNIYEGVPWWEANKTYHKQEGMSSHIDDLVIAIEQRKTWKEAAKAVQAKIAIEKAIPDKKEKVGSCGNGSAMRIPVLGAWLSDFDAKTVAEQAAYSALPTHDHPEGIAGAIATAQAAWRVSRMSRDPLGPANYWEHILKTTPHGAVYNGLMRASTLDLNAVLGTAMQILGNGTHVTCQDTVPLCCWLSIRGITLYYTDELAKTYAYKKIIEETTACGGDVDTTCAIVGGIVGTILDPPQEWIDFCKPMEGVVE